MKVYGKINIGEGGQIHSFSFFLSTKLQKLAYSLSSSTLAQFTAQKSRPNFSGRGYKQKLKFLVGISLMENNKICNFKVL